MGSLPVGLSASRGSAVLGLNKYQSSFEVWQRIMEEREPGFNERMRYTLPDEVDNASIRWGNAFEDAVVSLCESGAGRISGREEFFSKNIGEFDITCHIDGKYNIKGEEPDGLEWIESPRIVLHEGKTTSYYSWLENWGEPGSDEIPQEYAIQVQHQMICSGASEAIVSVLVFPKRVEEFEELGWFFTDLNGKLHLGKEGGSVSPATFGDSQLEWASTLKDMGYFHQYKVKANKEIQNKLIDLYQKWWNDYVIAEIPPVEGIFYDDLKRLIPNPVGTIVCAEDVENLFKEYNKAGVIEKQAKEVKEGLKIEILTTAKASGFIDKDTTNKWIFKNQTGQKLGQFNGSKFLASKEKKDG